MTEGTTVSQEADTRLRSMLQKLARGRGVRHAIMAIGTGGGEMIWTGAEGTADEAGTPMTPQTPFFLASVTKLYIATAVLRLMERGELELDAPMHTCLPSKLTDGLHRMDGVDRTGEITLRHLLGHATGLPEYLVLAREGEKSLFERVGVDLHEGWGIEEITSLVRDCGRPHFPPRPFDGQRHTIRYSDTNFQLLIAIIEAVYGGPLHEAFDALIFQPLALSRTFLPGTSAAVEASPDPAAFWGGDHRLDMAEGPLRSFRDLYSTAPETLRFMAALVKGEVFENPATAGIMREHFNPLAFSISLRPVGPGWPTEYGLGMIRFRMPRFFTGFRQAPTLFGHTGVTGSWLFHVPDLDLILSGTVDQVMGAPIPYRFVPRLVLALEELGIRGPDGG
jgi:D-alanyl-D-alanine carboxypeptidase